MRTANRTCLILSLLLVICATGRAFAQGLAAENFAIGVRTEFINETVHGSVDGGHGTLQVDNVISPFVRMEYELAPAWSLELQGSVDIYGGEFVVVCPGTQGKTRLHGYSLSMGPVWRGTKRTTLKRSWRPVLKAGLRYAWLSNDLKYPVTGYKPAWGADIACGLDFEQWELRLTATYVIHENRSTLPGYTGAEELNLSRIGLEAVVPIDTICSFFGKE